MLEHEGGAVNRIPPALSSGDTIAIVSPSWCGPAELPAAYRRGLAALRAHGYDVRVMAHAEGRRGWVSGTPQERVADLHDAFADPDVRAVLCTIGGLHSAQLLPLLDFDLIAANPKIFCGYSDITSLHLAIHGMTGLVTFYGPAVIPQWGAVGGPLDYMVDHFAQVVEGPQPAGALPRADFEIQDTDFERAERTGEPLRRSPSRPREVLRSGRASGPLVAACLPVARNLLGTPWQPDVGGHVLVLETPEQPYDPETADADLTHLRLAGWLDGLAALVLCRPYGFTDEQTELLHEALMEQVALWDYPVIARVEGGHTDPLPTFPLGVGVEVDGDEIVFQQPAVSDR
jgi:muramoyltetrapeptide carboxypeptidase